MASHRLADLLQEQSFTEVESTVYKVLGKIGVKHTRWRPDAALRAMISGFCVLFAYASGTTALIAQMGFLVTARGKWLDIVGVNVYDLPRITVTRASGEVTFTNTSLVAYNVPAGDMTVSASGTGTEYEVPDAFAIPPRIGSVNGSVTVVATAKLSGTDGSAEAGQIDQTVTTLPGVTVSNSLPFVGVDPETDEAYRVRCRDSMSALSPFGPKAIYSYVAKTTKREDGTAIGVEKVRCVPDGIGGVDVYCATDTAGISTADAARIDYFVTGQANDYTVPSAEPLGITARVHSATPVTVPITYSVRCYASANLANYVDPSNPSATTDVRLKTLIAASIAERIKRLPIGGDEGKLAKSSIVAAISDARPEIFRVDVSSPAGDVTLAASEFVVVGAITPTVSIVPSGDL